MKERLGHFFMNAFTHQSFTENVSHSRHWIRYSGDYLKSPVIQCRRSLFQEVFLALTLAKPGSDGFFCTLKLPWILRDHTDKIDSGVGTWANSLSLSLFFLLFSWRRPLLGQFLSENMSPRSWHWGCWRGPQLPLVLERRIWGLSLLQSTSYHEGSRWSVEPTQRE